MERAQHSPSRISVPELLKQLQDTQRELDNVKVIFIRFSFTIFLSLLNETRSFCKFVNHKLISRI